MKPPQAEVRTYSSPSKLKARSPGLPAVGWLALILGVGLVSAAILGPKLGPTTSQVVSVQLTYASAGASDVIDPTVSYSGSGFPQDYWNVSAIVTGGGKQTKVYLLGE